MNEKMSECGCKGIRTCLLCEKEKVAISSECTNESLLTLVYTYCPDCDLCWPEENSKNVTTPLFISNVMLIPDFVSRDEEQFLVSSIDQIAWMPSQSGRRKQDFGPKANFKKKKVKIGNFKGFPTFAKDIIERLQTRKELNDFLPVELCHLEYTPDRGSAIEPHIDDLWLWGDRLVTVNLLSPTVLTLTPTKINTCLDWPTKTRCNFSNSIIFDKYSTKKFDLLCKHRLNSIFEAPRDFSDTSQNFSEYVKEFCTVYDKEALSNLKIAIQIILPPRSLFVLSGCARCNWFHEIKRMDVTSRRLAMTFRELSENYLLENFDMKKIGDELLEISRNFCNFTEENT